MSEPIHELIEALQSEVSVSFDIDEPSNPDGEWWLDIEIDGMRSNVLWQSALGFGLFIDKNAQIHPLGLRELRHLLGETQSHLADSLGTDQARVSRLEKGADIKVSALINYLRAMGGRLELRAHFPTFEAPIEPVDPVAVKQRLN